jgi:hypothetical protein
MLSIALSFDEVADIVKTMMMLVVDTHANEKCLHSPQLNGVEFLF